jgi:hypothetical protein
LLKLLPNDFPRFYYRSAHRWYFDQTRLRQCVELARLQVESVRHLQAYGLSNAILWMKEKRPLGNTRLSGIGHVADKLWSGYLEATVQMDNLYILARKLV